MLYMAAWNTEAKREGSDLPKVKWPVETEFRAELGSLDIKFISLPNMVFPLVVLEAWVFISVAH